MLILYRLEMTYNLVPNVRVFAPKIWTELCIIICLCQHQEKHFCILSSNCYNLQKTTSWSNTVLSFLSVIGDLKRLDQDLSKKEKGRKTSRILTVMFHAEAVPL